MGFAPKEGIEGVRRDRWTGREVTQRRKIGSRGACELRVSRVLRRKERKGATLFALPNASVTEKVGRDLEAIEFGDAGHIGEGVNHAVGMVRRWVKGKRVSFSGR